MERGSQPLRKRRIATELQRKRICGIRNPCTAAPRALLTPHLYHVSYASPPHHSVVCSYLITATPTHHSPHLPPSRSLKWESVASNSNATIAGSEAAEGSDGEMWKSVGVLTA